MPRRDRNHLLVREILAFGARLDAGSIEDAAPAPDPEAGAFLAADPFAFLVCVLCDHGMRAERVWRIPLELRARLGHLDPARLVADPRAVARAFAKRPMLHRYVKTVPGWVVAAARRVLDVHGGDAAALWRDRPTAAELRRRFAEFEGIGQKKAAMAVEVLVRDHGVEIRELSGSDVAIDVHLRRTLRRTGLATRDDVAHLVDAARRAHPARPGALNLPLWTIGRRWCRATAPRCDACVLAALCPRLVAPAGRPASRDRG